jgi:ParB-like chromosome segregation protein Spo0J
MAMKIEAGENVGRADYWFVDPHEVNIREECRGRCLPPTEDQIIRRAVSMLRDGQLQPVICRRISPGNRLQLVLGFTRAAAARLIVDGFTSPTGEHLQNPSFQLKVLVRDCNDEDALKANIIENAEPNATTCIDDAHNQRRLREEYGKTDADIAALYQTEIPAIEANRRLLQLDRATQELVHHGDMSRQAALDLLDMPEDKRKEIVAEAVQVNGKVNSRKVREQVREHHLRDEDDGKTDGDAPDEEHSKPKIKAKPRSMAEVREWLERYAESDDEAVAKFAKVILGFIAGRRTPQSADDALAELRGKKKGK